jgi:hypothetical protein
MIIGIIWLPEIWCNGVSLLKLLSLCQKQCSLSLESALFTLVLFGIAEMKGSVHVDGEFKMILVTILSN